MTNSELDDYNMRMMGGRRIASTGLDKAEGGGSSASSWRMQKLHHTSSSSDQPHHRRHSEGELHDDLSSSSGHQDVGSFCGGGGGGICPDDDSLQRPLQRHDTLRSTSPTLPDYNDDPMMIMGGDHDMEQASQRSNGDLLTGIEVELTDDSDNNGCIKKKQYFNTFWAAYKRQMLTCCAFAGVFLLGVLVGTCGSGQCGARGERGMVVAAAVESQVDGGCTGDNSGTSTPGDTSGSPYATENPIANPIANTEPSFLGPNVYLFDPTMTTAEIQSRADTIFSQQQNNEMGTERYALLFQPGTYGSVDEPLMLQIGYYTEISGLGDSPNDVRVFGKIEVYNRVSLSGRDDIVCLRFLACLFCHCQLGTNTCILRFYLSFHVLSSFISASCPNPTPMASSSQPAAPQVFALH
jgi:hypothetical protein